MHAGDGRAITNIGQVNEKWAARQVSYLDRLIHEAGHQPGEWQQAQHTASEVVAPEAATWEAFHRPPLPGAYRERPSSRLPLRRQGSERPDLSDSTGDHQSANGRADRRLARADRNQRS
jgi:hypothetical protein